MHRYFIQVFGRVQGVGFRYFANYTALALDLTGWVKNCEDGSVQLEVQGKKENISLFIEKLKKGNRFAKIDDMNLKKVETITNDKSFRVIY
ncbi:acylphosphatase [Clostridium thailandense]|uniref:Acylphosphatase n=1 Tax=Clostridium thailandense TaxID=2794346 RepID=A0A949TS84_9CLOT|nr:acylphosphatase [Clostridium thailandense]MBV7274422.1 acylphosphatase [Clostridium thailandense]